MEDKITATVDIDDDIEEMETCVWCGCKHPVCEMEQLDGIGLVCWHCQKAMMSRGEL